MKNKLFRLRYNKVSSNYKCWDYDLSDRNFIYYYKISKGRYIFGNRFGIKLNIYKT